MSVEIISPLLRKDVALQALVSPENIYPDMAPEKVSPPYIILTLVSLIDGKKLDGEDEYYRSRVRVECMSQTATRSSDISWAVRDALRNVIKAKVGRFVDVDVFSAETDMSDFDDARTMFRRMVEFRSRFRHG